MRKGKSELSRDVANFSSEFCAFLSPDGANVRLNFRSDKRHFLNNFLHLRVSWNGDSLISVRNKCLLSDGRKSRYALRLQVFEKVSFLAKLTFGRGQI